MNRIFPLLIAFAGLLGSAFAASAQSIPLPPASELASEFASEFEPVVATEFPPVVTSSFAPLVTTELASDVTSSQEAMDEPTPGTMIEATSDTRQEQSVHDAAATVWQSPDYATRYIASLASMRPDPRCRSHPCSGPGCAICCPPSHSLYGYARIKSFLQRTQWGYCNHFEERPFGESMVVALSQQVDRGSQNMMMLYHYDFYPMESQRSAELTPRGKLQLMKMIVRMPTVAAPIMVQITANDPTLNQNRRQHVINSLALLGTPVPDEFVLLAPAKDGAQATEAIEIAENLQQSIISRGQTIITGQSAAFGE